MSKQKIAFITGVTGQDGSYLSKFLLDKGYRVIGMKRRTSLITTDRLDNMEIFNHPNFKLEYGNMTDSSSIYNLLTKYKPDEIYNLAAQSHVRVSFEVPEETLDVVGGGTLKLLEAYRLICPQARFYQASSSEMYGDNVQVPQNENTRMTPASPYAAAKLYAHNLCRNYREGYGLHISSGILFNHESNLRGETFVTRKITMAAANIKLGKQETLYLGNLEAKRDWGFAGDYCINSDVPILTTKGWKYKNELKCGDEIINFNPETNGLALDKINEIYIPNINSSKKIRISGRTYDLTCTPNHRIYYQQKSKKSKGGWSDWKINTAQNFYDMLKDSAMRTRYDYRMPHFQNFNRTDNEKWSDYQIYLVGALLAEGHLRDNKKGRGTNVSISQSAIANKIIHSKIEEINDALNLTARIRINNSGVTEWIYNSDSTEEILSWFDSNDIHVMPKWCFDLSSRQANLLFDSLMDCDGHWGSMTYTSKRSQLATDFQTIATLAGYLTTKPKTYKDSDCFRITAISKRKQYAYPTVVEEIDDKNLNVWCVNTKNGTIISRDNGLISISGNCEAMWLMLQQPKADDYVIATGETHTVREFLEVVFDHAGLDIQKHLKIDPRLFRPHEVPLLLGDYSKAKRILGWEPKTTFKELAILMYEADLENILKP